MVRIATNNKLSFRHARIINGWTLKEAAQHIGISPKKLSHYERNIGDMPLNVALQLLHLYGLPNSSLIFVS